MAPAFRHRESTSRAPAKAPSHRGGSDTLTMGAAGKKRKKVRRDQYDSYEQPFAKLTDPIPRIALVTARISRLCLTRWSLLWSYHVDD